MRLDGTEFEERPSHHPFGTPMPTASILNYAAIPDLNVHSVSQSKPRPSTGPSGWSYDQSLED